MKVYSLFFKQIRFEDDLIRFDFADSEINKFLGHSGVQEPEKTEW